MTQLASDYIRKDSLEDSAGCASFAGVSVRCVRWILPGLLMERDLDRLEGGCLRHPPGALTDQRIEIELEAGSVLHTVSHIQLKRARLDHGGEE